MLTFVVPARTAARSSASETPDEPCMTIGTGSAAWRRAMRSRSIRASRSTIA
jgi:hypothetical protein